MDNFPTHILDKAIKAVPAIRYALGVAGVAATVAIILGFVKDIKIAFFGITTTIALMVVLVVFSHLVKDLPGKRWLAALLAWTITLLFIALLILVFTSFVFGFPQKLATIFGRHNDPINTQQDVVSDQAVHGDKSINAQVEEIPNDVIKQIQVDGRSYTSSLIEWEIYNQTEWRLIELTIKITFFRTPIKDRIFHLKLSPESSGEPFKTSKYVAEVDLSSAYTYSHSSSSILSAKGIKNSPNINIKQDYIRPGSTVSLESFSKERTGSICCIVKDGVGQRYILSSSTLFFGDIGTPVYQVINKTKGQKVAELTRWVNHFDFADDPSNPPIRVAAGIARLLPNIRVTQEIAGVGSITGIATEVKKGDIVRVVGQRTGLIESKVQNVDTRLSTKDTGIGGWQMPSKVMFEGMILIDKVVTWTDAGAPVLTQDNRLVGIVCWSSNSGQEFTVVMPILPILNEFNLQIESDR